MLLLLTRFHLILKSIILWHQGCYQNSKLNESKTLEHSTLSFHLRARHVSFKGQEALLPARRPARSKVPFPEPRVFAFTAAGEPRVSVLGEPPGPAVRCPHALAAAGALLCERTAWKDLSSRGTTWGPAGPGPGGLDNMPTAQLWGQGHVLEPALCGSGWHP